FFAGGVSMAVAQGRTKVRVALDELRPQMCLIRTRGFGISKCAPLS
ncbi:MAG: hypothetical protein QOJ99_2161, partial [Bryobacterales bacterium]|nr:hypothetical protein [Bryobacterales bacterium]